ncbi:hypothetical protein [Sulfolobus sp. E11-6]|uniref:hypothetical protein n=1 Tax=Sulfolobus sp. E11-6 TaxID=2663020 RepID=UPI001EEB4436|nr:hypothetical protein [Sulfolobus sp. E11-6]
MMNTEEDYSLIYFKIKHEGCWSELTRDGKIIATTLYAKPDRERNSILAYDEIRINNESGLKLFIRALKNHKKVVQVYKILNIKKIDIESL